MKKYLFVSSLAFLALSFSACKKNKTEGGIDKPNPTTNQKPVVTITSPGSEVIVGQNFSIVAEASDPNGSIVKVNFYSSDIEKGSDNTSPYESRTFQYGNLGARELKAVAYDNSGDSTIATMQVDAVNSNK
ncbi:MAG: Ig-like domain-containing protein [Chitinophagaceae bacterium]|nr:Ig-like domain-containing protein [Chitinophagaceae bacterium]